MLRYDLDRGQETTLSFGVALYLLRPQNYKCVTDIVLLELEDHISQLATYRNYLVNSYYIGS